MVFELIEQSAPVSYAEQTLTNEQKAQARANIGAAEDTVLELVNSIEECVDTSKRYVLPDGYIYAYTYGEHTTENKNHILSSINTDGTPYNGGAGYKKGYRLNSSGVETSVSDNESIVSGFIPYNGQAVELRVPNTQIGYSSNYLHVYDSNFSVIKKDAAGTTIDGSYHNLQQWVNTYGATLVTEASTIKISFPAELLAISGISYIRVSSHVTTTVDSLTFNLALDEELDSSEVVTGYAWTNTGLYYGSADTMKHGSPPLKQAILILLTLCLLIGKRIWQKKPMLSSRLWKQPVDTSLHFFGTPMPTGPMAAARYLLYC